MKMKYKHIIWDWNGTLLDDVSECLAVLNELLQRRELPLLTEDQYRARFDFPVIDFYVGMGFDFNKESFEGLSVEFVNGYSRALKNAELFEHAKDILKKFKERNYTQIIISAMEKGALLKSLREKGIVNYFDHIIGIDDHYANGKLESAVSFIKKNNIFPEKTVLIGDTTHDFEVAEAIGCKCLLVSNGHQSPERLYATSVPVREDLKSILGMISN